MVYFSEYDSPIGRLLLLSDGEALTGLQIEGIIPGGALPGGELPVLAKAEAWLDRYFLGEDPPIAFPLAPEGTDFQRKVWDILLTIAKGETRTYGGIAREMAAVLGKDKMSAQAVGGAVGRNPIAILIPCHRVIGANGSLTGYAGGIDRKRWLLRHEGWKGEGTV
ncbi:MAG: methylated-DNA--[protein]-cysteine S-methyltransferase [Eubacteriales bacterium]|nr:methylated-DNA--[protein]-cysteine S-methyltransferase [Eubacteriales bacterium]